MIFEVGSQTNFHRILVKERNFVECGKTESEALGRLALSQICVNSAQRATKLTRHMVSFDHVTVHLIG